MEGLCEGEEGGAASSAVGGGGGLLGVGGAPTAGVGDPSRAVSGAGHGWASLVSQLSGGTFAAVAASRTMTMAPTTGAEGTRRPPAPSPPPSPSVTPAGAAAKRRAGRGSKGRTASLSGGVLVSSPSAAVRASRHAADGGEVEELRPPLAGSVKEMRLADEARRGEPPTRNDGDRGSVDVPPPGDDGASWEDGG